MEPKQVSCTGHSLGGSLCEAAVLAVPKRHIAWKCMDHMLFSNCRADGTVKSNRHTL